MAKKRRLSTLVIRRISKRFIRERYPQELDLFDTVWEIFTKLPRPLKKEKEERKLKFLRRKTVSVLGFTEQEALNLISPSVIAVISAANYHLGTLKGEIREEKIKEVVHIYAKNYRVKKELREEMITHIVPLLKLELPKLERIKGKPAARGRLEIGIRDAKPYVEIYGQEITEFRDREATFARLVLLAAARITKDKKYEEGYLSKEDDLFDPGGHETSRINKLIASKIEDIFLGTKETIIEAEKVGMARLNIRKVNISDSISNFESRYVRTLNRKIDLIDRILSLTPGEDPRAIEKAATLEFACRSFENIFLRTVRNTEMVERAMEIANKGEYDNSELRKLIKRTKILKERIRKIFPGFLKTNGSF